MRTDRLQREYDVSVSITHFPLHPETPVEGRPLAELFAGRETLWDEMRARLEAAMAAEGLPYGDRSMTYNSRLSQELAAWAVTQPGGEAIHDALFRAYFADGRNIGDPEVLAELVEGLGLPRAEAEAVMTARTFREVVDLDWQRSRQVGVTGVPTYVAAGLGVVGAQPYEQLESLVQQAGAERRAG